MRRLRRAASAASGYQPLYYALLSHWSAARCGATDSASAFLRTTMRVRPLTLLIILAGGLMLFSHYMFAMSTEAREPRTVRPPTLHKPGGGSQSTQQHGMPAKPEPDDEEFEEEEEGLDASDELDPGDQAQSASTGSTARSAATAATAAATDEEDTEEEEPPEAEPTIQGGGSTPGVPSLASIESAAATGREPYPTTSTELACIPPKATRPTRPLDYIVPLESAEWPTNCEGREDEIGNLCEVVRKTAIDRELLVAVCNSGIINQLEKWVESNRRAKISNMMIVAIDDRLPDWLEKNGVAYWRRRTSAAGSHKISAQKFGCAHGLEAATASN